MMGIGRQTDYAVRLVLHLACLEPGTTASIKEIAAQRKLPEPFVRRIAGRLVASGLVHSMRGFQGGIRLARPSAEITMLDVVLAMEDRLALNDCVDHTDHCPFAANCPVHVVWSRLTEDLRKSLAAIRFDQLAINTAGHTEAHRRMQALTSNK